MSTFFLIRHILPAARPVDDEAGKDGAGDADDGDDGVVAVGGVGGGVRVDALGEVEREEGVVERVCETDEPERCVSSLSGFSIRDGSCLPPKQDCQTGVDRELAAGEKRLNVRA